MQNLNYNPEEINRYIQSVTPQPQYTVPAINFEDYTRPTQNALLASPEQILGRRQAQGGDLYQPTPLPTDNNISQYSQYGINYDTNSDGKVGMLEGMTFGGLGRNILSNIREAGTGLVWAGTHLPEVGKAISDWGAETYYGAGSGNPLKAAGAGLVSLTDAVLDPYKLGSQDRNRILGDVVGSYLAGDKEAAKKYAQSGLSEITHRMYEQPFYVGLDVAAPFAGKALQGVTKGGKAATKAQSAISSKVAKISQNTEKIRSAGEAVVKNKSGVPTAKLVEAAETGVWNNIPQEAKVTIKNYSDVVNNTMKKYSPATWVEPEEMAITQKFVRDNSVTYQQAERQLRPLFDEMKRVRQEGGAITTRYVPNTGLADDVKNNIATIVDKFPDETPKFEEMIKSSSTAMEQTPEVLQGLRKILSPEEMYALKAATGNEVYDYIKNSRNLNDRGLSDILYDAGIKGIDGDRFKTFNSKKLGKYNTANGQLTLTKDADAGTILHEYAHKELDDLRKFATTGDTAAIEELNNVRKMMGLAEDAPVTTKVMEDFSDAVGNFVRTGELPEGELGEYIAKKYGRPETITKETGAVDSGIKHLEKLAAEGDSLAGEVANSAKLFKKGDIFPITHGLAEVDKAAGIDELGRIMAGRFSTRAFGNATYENIAKQIANPNDYINQLTKNYLDESVRDILKNGYSGDINIKPVNPKDAMYIPRDILEDVNKPMKQVLDSASNSPLRPDDIAIDKNFLKAFKDQYQLQQTNNPFGRTPLGDAYNLRKSTALASGGYLVGNLQTGVANAIMNSNVGLIDDIINATLTKGKLAKNLGVYRRDTFRNTNVTPAGKVLQDINLNTGGALLQKADSAIQNTMAEIAAHAELRRKGIAPKNRVSTIENMEATKLGDLINDVKLVSLINPTKSLAPSWMAGVGGVFNPFWRWVDTAAQSSLHMLNRHPVLANAVLFDVLAKAGYNKEMQSRLGIGVELDKPFVSYKVNPKTGEAREMSMEFLPQMNTLKFSSELIDTIKGKGDLDSVVSASIPLIGTTLFAMKGLNKYGKPMYRDHKSMYDSISVIDGKRYKLNPKTGLPEPEGGHLDEVISALANETLGSISLFNRTLAPSAAWASSKLTGQDYDYYLPYGQALFGSFARKGEAPTERVPFLVAGDPTRPRGDQEISNMIRGIYEAPYYPSPKIEQGIYNPTILRNFYKGLNRRDMREMNILMNR